MENGEQWKVIEGKSVEKCYRGDEEDGKEGRQQREGSEKDEEGGKGREQGKGDQREQDPGQN